MGVAPNPTKPWCRNPDFLVYWNRLKVKYIQKVAVRTEYTPKMADKCSCKKPGASSKRWVSQTYEGILWYLVMLPYPECHWKGRRFLKEYAYPQVLHLAEPSSCLLDLAVFWGGSLSQCISMSPSRCSLNIWLFFPLDLLDRVGSHFSKRFPKSSTSMDYLTICLASWGLPP